MLTFEQIKELIELVAKHRLSGLELERSGFRLKVDGETQVVAPAPTVVAAMPEVQAAPVALAAPAPVAAAAPVAAPATEDSSADDAADAVPDDAQVVTSPIVGTFYRSPNPDSPPFVEEGAIVEEGQILCIVEAMKLMNEIESDARGVVVKIFPANGQAVEYGEPLFAIRAS